MSVNKVAVMHGVSITVVAVLAAMACASVAQADCGIPVGRMAAQQTNASTDEDTPWQVIDKRPPEEQLDSIAQAAVKQSAQVGSQQLLAEAAQFDLREMVARGGPQGNLNLSVGPSIRQETGYPDQNGLQGQGGFNFSGIIFDGGRQTQLAAWRQETAKAAQAGFLQSKEQVVLEAVSTALERNRYRMQTQVYQQHVRKMSCLVGLLQEIVAEDRGRVSELAQARKSLAQAEISRDTAQTIAKQLEARLRKYIGDDAATGDSISGALAKVMDAGEVLRKLDQGFDFQSMRSQVEAAEKLADSTEASRSPQINWVLSGTSTIRGSTRSVGAQAGISLNYNFFDGGANELAALAARRRASAAKAQYQEFSNVRVARVAELYEAATSSFDRAKRLVSVLRESDSVRQSTFQQWAQLGRRSLFDVMSSESDHFNLRVSYVNALYDGYVANAQMRSMGGGLMPLPK